MNIPKLRFKEFTDEWKTIRLQKIISIYKEQSTIENQYPMLTSSKQGLILQKDYYSDNARITNRSNIGYNILPYGYITYRNRSDTGFFTFNINLKLEKGLISYFYPVFSLVNSNKYFLVNLLNAKYQFKMYAISEGTSQKVLSITNLKKLKVLCPNLKEQNKIANFLSTVDKKISNLENIITTLENQKKGLLQQIFNQEIRFKDENGNNYPDWISSTIGKSGDFYYGKSAPKWSITDTATTPCVRYGELYTTHKIIVKKIYSYTNIPKENLKFSTGNEVLVPRVGEEPLDFCKCCYLPFKNVAIGEMISVYNTKNNPLFISYMFNATMKYKFARFVEGGNVSNLYYSYLKNIKIELPCLEEQTKIADFLSAFDRKIDNQKAQLEHWKQIKKGLLQQMFV